ncbi:MAG TPA: hypothetical protein VNX68_05405 [Nitrosopumilaceae archaeon]|jgi:hypothetical protein|nr:hypothetical protein [Nitrosopumilaceae archaeon]
MKRIILLFVIVSGAIFGQETPSKEKGANKTSGTTETTKKPAATFKDADLVNKEWVLKTSERWGVVDKPNDTNKDDKLFLNSDGTFKLTLNNAPKTGKWKRGGAYITFTQEASTEKLKYKLLSVDATILKAEWREDDGLYSIFEFEVK